jgi:hypothetical protein
MLKYVYFATKFHITYSVCLVPRDVELSRYRLLKRRQILYTRSVLVYGEHESEKILGLRPKI